MKRRTVAFAFLILFFSFSFGQDTTYKAFKKELLKSSQKALKRKLVRLNKSIEKEPSGQNYFFRGMTKTFMNDYEAALPDYKKAIALNYKNADIYFELGNLELCMGRDYYADALNDLATAISINKEYYEAYSNRGFIYLQQGKWNDALREYNAAITLKGDNLGDYLNRGSVRNNLGDLKGACADWQTAISLATTMDEKRWPQERMDKFCK